MQTGARPVDVPGDVWGRLLRTGLVEGDFHGPRGIVNGFQRHVGRWIWLNKDGGQRKVVAGFLMAAGIVLFVAGAVLYNNPLDDFWQPQVLPPPEGEPVAPNQVKSQPVEPAPQRPQTITEKRAVERNAFLARRRSLEEAVLDAEGDLIVEQFPSNGIGQLEIDNYVIPISVNDGTMVYAYNDHPSLKWLAKVGAAEGHETFDVTLLEPAERTISLIIGECAVAQTTDGKIIQILLVGAHARMSGDATNDASFKYRVYEPGTSLIKALRNGTKDKG